MATYAFIGQQQSMSDLFVTPSFIVEQGCFDPIADATVPFRSVLLFKCGSLLWTKTFAWKNILIRSGIFEQRPIEKP